MFSVDWGKGSHLDIEDDEVKLELCAVPQLLSTTSTRMTSTEILRVMTIHQTTKMMMMMDCGRPMRKKQNALLDLSEQAGEDEPEVEWDENEDLET